MRGFATIVKAASRLCPRALQRGYDRRHHNRKVRVFQETRTAGCPHELTIVVSETRGALRAEGAATMTDSTRLQIVAILMLICGALGIIVVMR